MRNGLGYSDHNGINEKAMHAKEPSDIRQTKTIEAVKPESRTFRVVDTTHTKAIQNKTQDSLYTNVVTPKVQAVLEEPKNITHQESVNTFQDPTKLKTHRRMSSVSSAALLSDIMHVSVDQAEPGVHSNDKHTATTELNQDLEENTNEKEYSTTERRKSTGIQRKDSERRKKEYMVAQSDLWDTNTFTYTSPKPQSPHHHLPMQRSVSEKSPRQGSSSPHQHRGTDTAYTGERRASNVSINCAGITQRVSTPEGYRDAETLRMQDKLSKRRGSEFSQPVTTSNKQTHAKRRQSSAYMRAVNDELEKEVISKPLEQRPKNSPEKVRSDPDTKKMPGQASPSRRLMQEAEPLKRAKGAGDTPRLVQASHYKSSPNVAVKQKTATSEKSRQDRKLVQCVRSGENRKQDSVEQRKMYTASSESELFECAILPIFQKLLTERHKSQPQGLNLTYGVSCPNISIKCDIVEYL